MRRAILTLISVMLVAGPAWALEKNIKCEADKVKILGKYGFCKMKELSKARKKQSQASFQKCLANYNKKWELTETKAAGECPTKNDKLKMQKEVDKQTDKLAKTLKNDPNDPAEDCGNDMLDPNNNEQCDGADLGGADCESLGYSGGGNLSCTSGCFYDTTECECAGSCPATGQVSCWDPNGTLVSCAGTGHDGEILAGVALSYVDNLDGTITDLNTGLMWEKKSDDGTIHDKDTTYSWADAFANVATLNDPNAPFATYMDWRLPNVKELEIIVDYETFTPSVDPVFDTGCVGSCTVMTCSCTDPGFYWSSTSSSRDPVNAWGVEFFDGGNGRFSKSVGLRVRAVRDAP